MIGAKKKTWRKRVLKHFLLFSPFDRQTTSEHFPVWNARGGGNAWRAAAGMCRLSVRHHHHRHREPTGLTRGCRAKSRWTSNCLWSQSLPRWIYNLKWEKTKKGPLVRMILFLFSFKSIFDSKKQVNNSINHVQQQEKLCWESLSWVCTSFLFLQSEVSSFKIFPH